MREFKENKGTKKVLRREARAREYLIYNLTMHEEQVSFLSVHYIKTR